MLSGNFTESNIGRSGPTKRIGAAAFKGSAILGFEWRMDSLRVSYFTSALSKMWSLGVREFAIDLSLPSGCSTSASRCVHIFESILRIAFVDIQPTPLPLPASSPSWYVACTPMLGCWAVEECSEMFDEFSPNRVDWSSFTYVVMEIGMPGNAPPFWVRNFLLWGN